jgi:hypothetical protein
MIRSSHLPVERDLRDRIDLLLRSIMEPVEGVLDGVEVYLTDVNGPRGGADKHCRIVARLSSGRPVVASRSHRDVLAAVGRAATLCRRSVRTRLKRKWSGRGRPRRNRPALEIALAA